MRKYFIYMSLWCLRVFLFFFYERWRENYHDAAYSVFDLFSTNYMGVDRFFLEKKNWEFIEGEYKFSFSVLHFVKRHEF